jgi:hypothetical protein
MAMAEEPSGGVPHLEEPEVLAILRRRMEPRLAPGDVDRLPAVPLEDGADRDLRGRRPQLAHVLCMERVPQLSDLVNRSRELPFGLHKRLPRDSTALLGSQQPAMRPEEVDGGSLLAQEAHLAIELRRESERMGVVPGDGSSLVRALHFRCRRALCGQEQHAQANDYGLQNVDLLLGDRGATP